MKNKLGQAVLTTAILFGISAAAVSVASAQTERTVRTTQNRAIAICQGFGQEFINARTRNTATSTSSDTFVEMANTRIGGGASGDIDLYVFTFSGEARGGPWEIKAQVSFNGGFSFFDMNPNEPNTFHAGKGAETHTMSWCREIQGDPTFRILWRKIGASPAVVDDYFVQVERSN